jgi:myo-inositol-1(or 4)-monophosphatase
MTKTARTKKGAFASRCRDVERIEVALRLAMDLLRRFSPTSVETDFKGGGDPVTAADRAANALLREMLVGKEEGWLSEETEDTVGRLAKRRVWVVDPLDGTKEFLQGIPEWCVSIGLVEAGVAVAGGVANPSTGEIYIGSVETGFVCNVARAEALPRTLPAPKDHEVVVLASRSEYKNGKWECYRGDFFQVIPTGSVAGRLARVAAGLADATWTLDARHEWDVAAGVALIRAAGGRAEIARDVEPTFNQMSPRFDRLAAFAPNRPHIAERLRDSAWNVVPSSINRAATAG